MATVKLGDYDIWYHLRAGEYIFTTGSVIHLDPFSYTAADRPWSVQSWLIGVIFYSVYSAAGFNGLILFNAAVITTVFFVLYLNMRIFIDDRDDRGLVVILLIVAAFTARFRFMVRPHIFEFLFLVSLFYILNLYRFRNKNYLFLLPLIQVLWVNIHGSHVLGLIVPLIYILGDFLQRLFPKLSDADNRRRVSEGRISLALALVLLANITATFINPYTYKAFSLPFLITGQKAYMQNIGEWQPLQWYHLWGYSLRYTWGFLVLMILGVTGFIFRLKRFNVTDFLIFAFFLLAAVKGIRLTAEFGLVASVIILRNFYGLSLTRSWTRMPAFSALLAIFLVFVIPPAIVFSPTYAFGLGIKENKFPGKALRFIEDNHISGNMFNSFAFGDYLTWNAFPGRKVFIHGRNEVFPEDFYRDYLNAHKSPEVWNKVVEKYNITFALLEYYLTDLSGRERIPHIMTNSGWVPVYWDRTAIVYVNNIPANREVLDRWGNRYIRPTYLDFSYLHHYMTKEKAGSVLSELDRLIKQSPDNEEAYLARAYIFFFSNSYDMAMADVKKALTINPGRAVSHSALGMLYQKTGNTDGALKEFKEALRIDPNDIAALAEFKSRRSPKQ